MIKCWFESCVNAYKGYTPGVRFLKKLTTVRRRKPIRLTLSYV